MMFYLCCFGSHADGGNEEPPDRRQASVDSRQSRAGQGKTWVLFCLGDSSRLFTSDTSHVLCSSSKLCDLTDFIFFYPLLLSTSQTVCEWLWRSLPHSWHSTGGPAEHRFSKLQPEGESVLLLEMVVLEFLSTHTSGFPNFYLFCLWCQRVHHNQVILPQALGCNGEGLVCTWTVPCYICFALFHPTGRGQQVQGMKY